MKKTFLVTALATLFTSGAMAHNYTIEIDTVFGHPNLTESFAAEMVSATNLITSGSINELIGPHGSTLLDGAANSDVMAAAVP